MNRTDQARLLGAAHQAATTIVAIYAWLDRVEQAGGTASVEGVAATHVFLTSLRKQEPRVQRLVLDPLNDVLIKLNKGETR